MHSTKIQRSWIVKRWICLYWQMCSQIFRSPWKYWQKVNRTFNERSRIPTKSRRCGSVVNRQSNHAMSDLHTTFKVSVQDSLCFFFNYYFFTHEWGGRGFCWFRVPWDKIMNWKLDVIRFCIFKEIKEDAWSNFCEKQKFVCIAQILFLIPIFKWKQTHNYRVF